LLILNKLIPFTLGLPPELLFYAEEFNCN